MSWSAPSQPSSSPAPVVVVIHASAAPQVVHIHLHPHEPQAPSTAAPTSAAYTHHSSPPVPLAPPPLPTTTLRDNQPAPAPSPPRPAPAWRRVQSSPALVSAGLGDPFAESEQWFTLHAHRPPSTAPTWLGPATEPAWRSVRREQGLELFVDSPASPALFPQPDRRQPEPEPEPLLPQAQQMQMHQLHHEQQLRQRPRRAYVETDTEHEHTDTDTLSTRSRSVVSRLIHLTDTESRAESVLHLRRSEASMATSTRVSETTQVSEMPIRTVPVSHPENDDTEPEPETDGDRQEELFEAARALWAQTHQEDEQEQQEPEQQQAPPPMPEATHWNMQLVQAQQQQAVYPAQMSYYTPYPAGQFSQPHDRPPIHTQPLLAQLTPTSLDEPVLPRPMQVQRPSQSRFHSQEAPVHEQEQDQYAAGAQVFPQPHVCAQDQPQQHFQFAQPQPQPQPHSHAQARSPRAQLYPQSQSPRSLLHAQLYPHSSQSQSSPRAQLTALLQSQLQLFPHQPASQSHSHSQQPTSHTHSQPSASGASSSLNPFLSPPPQQRRVRPGMQQQARPSTWHEQAQPSFAPFALDNLGPVIVHPDTLFPPLPGAPFLPRSMQPGNEAASSSPSMGRGARSPRPAAATSPPRNVLQSPQRPAQTQTPPRVSRHPALASPGSVYRPPSVQVPPSPNLHLTHALSVEPWNWVDHPVHLQGQWGVVPS